MAAASTAIRASVTTAEESPSVDAKPAPFCRWGWHSPSRCVPLFSSNSAFKRWRAGLAGELVDRKRTPIMVRGDAVLPDGQRLMDALQQGLSAPLASVSQEARQGTEKQRRNEKLRIELLIRDKQFQAANPSLPPTTPQYFERFRAEHGRWAAEHRLGCGRSVLMGLRRRGAMGEPLWAAYKCGRKRRGDDLFDPDIFDDCITMDLHPHKFSATGAYSIYEYGKARAWKEGKAWNGSETTFARRLKAATPNPIRRAGREGMWAAEAYCIPKVERGLRTQYAPGETVSLDGRKADQFVRVPKSGGGWRHIRPLDVVLFDMGSNKLVALHTGDRTNGIAAGRIT